MTENNPLVEDAYLCFFNIIGYLVENHQRIENRCDENDQEDEDIEIEIIEVEEPEEPVPMQDSCLQVNISDTNYIFHAWKMLTIWKLIRIKLLYRLPKKILLFVWEVLKIHCPKWIKKNIH